ncbi:MAG: electron transfer flavoprotein subunit beta/FixA family protein [Gammaproteobacteria bacterium]|nr:electron transfer flavoprotein subunit beta/FixA family protein [Gammaproteobacteria bacterium]
MKALVTCKRVLDPYIKARINADGSAVNLDNVKMAMNPFDEIAVEEALRLKEAGSVTEVVAVSIGGPKSEETLRQALAMGADRAILVESDQDIEPLAVAKVLKAVCDEEQPGLVLMGKQAIDGDSNQAGQMLAGMLNWAQGTFISEIKIDGETANVTREIDGGLEKLSLKLPAVVTADLRLNEPRYASLPNIMKAKKKPLDKKPLADMGIDTAKRIEIVGLSEPAERQAGVMVDSVAALVEKLKTEAKVI